MKGIYKVCQITVTTCVDSNFLIAFLDSFQQGLNFCVGLAGCVIVQ